MVRRCQRRVHRSGFHKSVISIGAANANWPTLPLKEYSVNVFFAVRQAAVSLMELLVLYYCIDSLLTRLLTPSVTLLR